MTVTPAEAAEEEQNNGDENSQVSQRIMQTAINEMKSNVNDAVNKTG